MTRPLLAFISCSLIWGSTFLAIRIGNDTLPPLWACTLRLATAAIILNLILFATGRRWPRGIDLKAACLYGFWEFGLSMSLLYWGEKAVPSSLAAVIFAVCPVSAVLLGFLFGWERFSSRRLAAALVAFSGVAVIFWRETVAGGSTLGLGLILVAALAAPVAGFMLRQAPALNAVAANAVGATVAIPICLAASLALGEPHPWPATAPGLFPVLYLAIAGSVCAFVLFAWLISQWKVSTVAFIAAVIPVIAITLGSLLRHETFAPGSIVGGAMVLLGVVFVLKLEQAENLVEEPITARA